MWLLIGRSVGALTNKYSFSFSCILQGDEDGILQVRRDSVEARVQVPCWHIWPRSSREMHNEQLVAVCRTTIMRSW